MSWLNQIFKENNKLKLLQLLPEEEKSSWGGEFKIPLFLPNLNTQVNTTNNATQENVSNTNNTNILGVNNIPGITGFNLATGDIMGKADATMNSIYNNSANKYKLNLDSGLNIVSNFKSEATPTFQDMRQLQIDKLNETIKNNSLFNNRGLYKDTEQDYLLRLLDKRRGSSRSNVRDYLRLIGLNPYSLSAAQRKKLRLAFEDGSFNTFRNDINSVYGENKLSQQDYQNTLIDWLDGGNGLLTLSRKKFDEQDHTGTLKTPEVLNDPKYLQYNKPAPELTPELKFWSDLASIDKNSPTLYLDRVKLFQNYYNTLGFDANNKPIGVDGKLGKETMSAFKAFGVNLKMSEELLNLWVNDVFGGLKYNLPGLGVKKVGGGRGKPDNDAPSSDVPEAIKRPEAVSDVQKMMTSNWDDKMKYRYTGPRASVNLMRARDLLTQGYGYDYIMRTTGINLRSPQYNN